MTAVVTGHVDGFEGLYLNGWAIAEPDSSTCNIQVVNDDGKVIAKGRASRERPDLEVLGRGRRNFAFHIPVVNAEPGLIHVLADGVELGRSPIRIGPGSYDGAIAIGGGIVEGWVSERVAGFDPPHIEVRNQDDEIVAAGPSASDRSQDDLFRPASFTLPLLNPAYGRSELQVRAFANGAEFARSEGALSLLGFIDACSHARCTGWLLSPEAPDKRFDINVYRDGELAGHGRANLARADVLASHPGFPNVGFDIKYDVLDEEPRHVSHLSFRLPDSNVELFGGPFTIGRRLGKVSALRRAAQILRRGGIGDGDGSLGHAVLAEAIAAQRIESDDDLHRIPTLSRRESPKRRVSVIIPIYRDVEVTRTCIESVLTHRDAEKDVVILINDCSPDEGMAEMLRPYTERPNVFLMTNAVNQGFIRTVNRGLRFFNDGDVVLLNSDTRVFAGWLDELLNVAHSSPEIGTVTALSNNATIFSYPNPRAPAASLADMTWENLAAVALRANAGVAIDVPTGHGFCLLIKRQIIAELGVLNEAFGRGYGEENELCMRAADVGYRNVAAAGVLVEHRESISFGSERQELISRNIPRLEQMFPEYTPMVTDYERRDDLRRARWPLDAFRLKAKSANGTRFALVVTNWLTGGTRLAIGDIEATGLYDDLTTLKITCDPDGMIHLECSVIPVHAVFQPSECRALFELLAPLEVEFTIVHQLLGFPLQFLEQMEAWSLAHHTVYYVHDFYPACPRVTLIDALDQFCDLPDVATCARCTAIGGSHEASRLTELTPRAHRELFGAFLSNCAHVVTPSMDAAGYIKRAFADIEPRVLPHPEIMVRMEDVATEGALEDIVLLGAIGPHKGAHRLLEIAGRARLTHPHLTFHVVGHTSIDEALLQLGNVKITGRYEPEELQALVAATRGRIALFLHTWPETFSYTLTEALQLGLMPVVPDLGAPAERVRAAGYGVIYPHAASASELLKTLDGIASAGTTPPPPARGTAAADLATSFARLRVRLTMEDA